MVNRGHRNGPAAVILGLLLAAPLLLFVSRPAPAAVTNSDMVRDDAGRRMDRYLESAQHFGFSGAVLVADRRGIVLRKGYGPADAGRRVEPGMVFDMGSITKQFTAAGILLLEAERRLKTSDSLGRFFRGIPADKRGITIHQLLTHTSGLVSDFADDYAQMSRDSAVRAIFSRPLVSPPGQAFNYSNAGFSLLAIIMEQVTGRPYERFMTERIYRPIGMRHTGYAIGHLDSTLVARTYTPPVDHGTPAERLHRAGGPGWNLNGNGGVLTTVDDLYRYELALRAGRRIPRAVQVKQFAEQYRRSPTLAHGYDWWIETSPDDTLFYDRGADGPPTGVSGEYRRYPRDSTVFILLANNRHHGASTRRYVMPNLRRLFLGTGTFDLPAVQGAPAEMLEAIAGTYQVDSTSSFTVTRQGDHLALGAVGQAAVNVMVFNRDSTSLKNRERLNQRAMMLVQALAAGDTATLRPMFTPETDLERPLAWWQGMVGRLGAFRRAEVLGTDRLDRGMFMSTVRLFLGNASKTVRWAWAGPIATQSSEDAYLPGAFEFGAESPVAAASWSPYWWLTGGDSLVTYDMAFDRTLRATIVRGADGAARELVFHVPSGDVPAVRIAPTPRSE
jgi:CubicO group peptidase (beta-lactamase class C family)